ncbi:MAG: hypothetical protein EXR81_01045 [Gammaproteobacteria bacterium]|nr:hypothetical protein [Gammaproteobacteria bacterium]
MCGIIGAVANRKFKMTTDSEHTKPVFKNILNRDFSTTTINQKWCGDITYIHTAEGWLYLAIIIEKNKTRYDPLSNTTLRPFSRSKIYMIHSIFIFYA